MRVLLVDDDPFALKLLAWQLERLGYADIEQYQRAEDALLQFDSSFKPIDLVFCDLQMPDIDGVEFVRHLAGIGYRGDMVLVSGEDGRILQTVQKLALAHDIHLLGTLAKPVKFEQLEAMLGNNVLPGAAASSVVQQHYPPDELKLAIERGELLNYYQPKVAMGSGALVGVEALVRWQHPQAGLVYPDRFIATAEEHGLIDDLTRAVLSNALAQSRRWREAGLDLQMAVNVSMDNLAALDFPDLVVQLAGEAGVPLPTLILEVTESRLMMDQRGPLDILTRLRLKRIGLSIDDFGTGHSSLAQLRDIPFNELKLDRGFIDGVANDAALSGIVQATLAMARQLEMKSVAEGIEGRADWDCLRLLGCDVGQGYFIARPMLASEIPAWHAGWKLRLHELTAYLR
jgi:EAL domain-containing protein (putative c-di-GMP-specific phosphodiesterase class I)/ActR/RegA family two-component response regulator